jgi:hypothetical protein
MGADDIREMFFRHCNSVTRPLEPFQRKPSRGFTRAANADS